MRNASLANKDTTYKTKWKNDFLKKRGQITLTSTTKDLTQNNVLLKYTA
jgi:hypothetical protein